VLPMMAELGVHVFWGCIALKTTSCAFGEKVFFVNVDEGGAESLPAFDIGETGGNGASYL